MRVSVETVSCTTGRSSVGTVAGMVNATGATGVGVLRPLPPVWHGASCIEAMSCPGLPRHSIRHQTAC